MIDRSLNKEKQNLFVIVLVFLLGLFFHQSARTSLGNNSLADIILVITLIYMILNRKFILPRVPTIIFLFFSAYITFVSIIYIPMVFPVGSQLNSFLINYIKLVVLFLFFILGYFLSKYMFSDRLIKVYSYSAFGISILGLLGSLLYIPGISVLMFKYGLRLNGLMNDPNYFAILQVTAIPYFVIASKVKKIYRIIIITLLVLSVILSGSKTGFIVLASYIAIKIIERFFLFRSKLTLKTLLKRFLLVTCISICLFFVIINFNTIIQVLIDTFPIINRITILLFDFDSGISSGGSGRDIAWNTGFNIIQLSPFLGVGINHYLSIAKHFFGVNVIAHNTYLQLAAEWGLPISILFFGSIIILLIYFTFKYRDAVNILVQRDITIIFLLGSIAISLNNARFFWLVLGSLVYSYAKNRRRNNKFK